jgi:hypothetical protein
MENGVETRLALTRRLLDLRTLDYFGFQPFVVQRQLRGALDYATLDLCMGTGQRLLGLLSRGNVADRAPAVAGARGGVLGVYGFDLGGEQSAVRPAQEKVADLPLYRFREPLDGAGRRRPGN